MTSKELFDRVKEKAIDFGMKEKGIRGANAIVRENLECQAFSDGKAFFGFIRIEEENSGVYSDFSFVVFPDNCEHVENCVICLGVGSQGFKNDFQLALRPGIRRHFIQLANEQSFFKSDFSDISDALMPLIDAIQDYPSLFPVIKRYENVLQAATIVNLEEEGSLDIIYRWLAIYAKVRKWDKNKKAKSNIQKALDGVGSGLNNQTASFQQNEIKTLLENRRFVVLQGAPGTGKTWNAIQIAQNYNKKFFVQFHAETTYSDFIGGIQPALDNSPHNIKFKEKKGILCKALEYAKEHSEEKVLLIIDEINRANLSNVLGPVFFLFENTASNRKKADVEIEVGGKTYEYIPENLYVVATMNTADRSLAVVDFALRRRFAWYTLRPIILKTQNFDDETFKKFADIFFEYATDNELNLQPGQAYFMDKNQTQEKLKYELMPLIKEYIEEGYLTKAKDEFSDLFFKEANVLMYE